MFSLGIILFELYFAPKTDMERIHSITSLKDNYKFPNDFENDWKIQVNLLKLTYFNSLFKSDFELFFFFKKERNN